MKWILFFWLLVVVLVGMSGNARGDIEWAVRRERRLIAEAKRRMAQRRMQAHIQAKRREMT